MMAAQFQLVCTHTTIKFSFLYFGKMFAAHESVLANKNAVGTCKSVSYLQRMAQLFGRNCCNCNFKECNSVQWSLLLLLSYLMFRVCCVCMLLREMNKSQALNRYVETILLDRRSHWRCTFDRVDMQYIFSFCFFIQIAQLEFVL